MQLQRPARQNNSIVHGDDRPAVLNPMLDAPSVSTVSTVDEPLGNQLRSTMSSHHHVSFAAGYALKKSCGESPLNTARFTCEDFD